MNYQNIIKDLIESIGMKSEAVWVGLIGAVFHVLYKVNGFGWRMSLVIVFSGGFLSGYVMPVLEPRLSSEAIYLVCFLIGYLSAPFFQYLHTAAPSLFRLAGEVLRSYIKKHKHDNGEPK